MLTALAVVIDFTEIDCMDVTYVFFSFKGLPDYRCSVFILDKTQEGTGIDCINQLHGDEVMQTR